MTIYAAGAILWREEKGKLLVAIIHRSRHNDWSWPKGKVDPGELLPETAVREIEEETGLRIKLGPFLKTMFYKVPSGTPKEVHYWSARVTDSILQKSTFKPTEEVAKVDWKTPEEARVLLTYSMDHEVLDRFLEIYEQGNHRTKAVIVLRHAKATPRSEWKGGKNVEDGERPLLSEGFNQAQRLVPLIRAFAPKRLVTSPWARCLTTISPYAKRMKLNVIQRSQLSELGNKKGPRRTKKVVLDVLEDNRTTLICTHRPALPTVFETLAKYASGQDLDAIALGVTLKPAEMMVMHFISDEKGKRKKIVSVERYGVI
jgi:8-oxo-dGTP pyrophosphatase MutT (NUDIX family)